MEINLIEILMDEYGEKYNCYATFTTEIQKLISTLLEEGNVKFHSITSRTKSIDSLRQKLSTLIDNNINLDDVLDLTGIRIITYFDDDVDKVAKIISNEFQIDASKSSDKKELIEPDKFGYLSLHYVGQLSQKRLALTEYQRFVNYKFEIQVRSILQHAWAEIEHDLGYKTKNQVPKEIRRRFCRLAGLLEIADTEFIDIRDNLERYKTGIKEQINTEPKEVLIDSVSLGAFIENSTIVANLDNEIAATFKAIEIVMKDSLTSKLVDLLQSVGLNNMKDLNSALSKYKDFIIPFAKKWISSTYSTTNKGISLFYLCYVMIGASGSTHRASNFLNQHNLGSLEQRNKILPEKIISIFNEVSK